jgi:hypothetical protein
MGCDFYIQVYLEIQHANGISYYKLPIIRGYYCELECGVCDSDEDEKDYYYNTTEYKNLCDDMKKICLKPRNPIVIYKDNTFITPKLESKYLPLIQEKINDKDTDNTCIFEDTGVFTNISEVVNITKKEIRYER